MHERLSDERLHELCGIPQAMPWREVPQMAQELLALRAQLAAGPVMPAAPSDNVLRAGLSAFWDRQEHGAGDAFEESEVGDMARAFSVIRAALANDRGK